MTEIMNARERFHSIMHYKDVDRIPLWSVEAVTEGAIRRWIKDGDYPIGMSLADVFELDPHEIIKLDTEPLPAFVSQTIADDERWRITTDKFGFTVKTLKEQSVGPKIYYYVGGVVEDRQDWEALKKRYDPVDPRRMPRAWSPELVQHYNNAAGPVALRIDWGPGRGVKNGYTLGLERFLEVLVENPGLIKDMLDFWADFVIELSRDYVCQCKIDYAFFAEDGIGYKNSSLVSPKMYRDIWIPPMRRVVDFLNSHGINLIAHYSSGNLIPLIPVLLDIGVNMSFPLEVAARMDALALRRKFGREFRMIGNVSRQALMDGPEAVEEEFYAKVLPMMEIGGFIPAVDDAIMPDISFASYQHYLELVRDYRF
jgi:uroporphyrinogen-III decarboxylase